MPEVIEDLRKALENHKAVERYAAGYRREVSPQSELDRAVSHYKQEKKKQERMARFFAY
jgi:hypothetical protein